MIITILKPENFNLLVNYQNENKKHLSQWEPSREQGHFSPSNTEQRVNNSFNKFQQGTELTLVAFHHKEKTKIIGQCSFSNIIYGAFRACNLGYSICEQEQGKGLMFELLHASIEYMFDELKLHRVMANYMPSNTRSEQLLNRLGFQKEGYAKSYLEIAGVWQDHVLTSKIKIDKSKTNPTSP